jgi:AcrR family transcriptional regulator
MALSKSDWIEAAKAALASDGLAGVAVEPVAKRLGATKGSFYWHFRNRDALVQAVLEDWEKVTTDDAIDALRQMPDPVERLRLLLHHAMDDQSPSAPLDLAIVALGSDPRVRPVLGRVQAKRVAFLETIFTDMEFPREEAKQRARVAYSAYLGWFVLVGATLDDQGAALDREAYQDTVIELLSAGYGGRP